MQIPPSLHSETLWKNSPEIVVSFSPVTLKTELLNRYILGALS
jgi:hypothetical protein